MIFAINCGHTLTGKGTGATGYINESKETRETGNLVMSMLRSLGHTVIDCTVDRSDNYLAACVSMANKQNVDLAVSIHFNAGGGTGTETLIYSGSNDTATRVNNEICKLGFPNRGIKLRPELYWLRNTRAKAILIECCFVDSKNDTNRYKPREMAEAIVRGLTGQVPATNKDTFFRVVVGSYKERANAEKVLAEAKSKGFNNAFLTTIDK